MPLLFPPILVTDPINKGIPGILPPPPIRCDIDDEENDETQPRIQISTGYSVYNGSSQGYIYIFIFFNIFKKQIPVYYPYYNQVQQISLPHSGSQPVINTGASLSPKKSHIESQPVDKEGKKS
jgi:hypothetical protein